MAETLEIQNTPLLVWYYYRTVAWNRDKPLAPGSCHAKCPKSSFCVALYHSHDTPEWGTRITEIATWHQVECDYKPGMTINYVYL